MHAMRCWRALRPAIGESLPVSEFANCFWIEETACTRLSTSSSRNVQFVSAGPIAGKPLILPAVSREVTTENRSAIQTGLIIRSG